jgi:hypothetical protein
VAIAAIVIAAILGSRTIPEKIITANYSDTFNTNLYFPWYLDDDGSDIPFPEGWKSKLGDEKAVYAITVLLNFSTDFKPPHFERWEGNVKKAYWPTIFLSDKVERVAI